MAGISVARDDTIAGYAVPQLFTQCMAERPGESGLSASQGQNDLRNFKDQDQIPAEENTLFLQMSILPDNTPHSKGARPRENHLPKMQTLF